MIYDIRNTQYARETLAKITSVDIETWKTHNLLYKGRYEYVEQLIEDVISRYGHMPTSLDNTTFVYSHITTSANECFSIKKHGLLNLCDAYMLPDSELNAFLSDHNIFINLDDQVLRYNNIRYNISFDERPNEDNVQKYRNWCVGRKFFYDYTTCGFLSVDISRQYGGLVHIRPEILFDIDCLLKTSLSKEWSETHSPFEVIAKVTGKNIVYDVDNPEDSKNVVMKYIYYAFSNSFDDSMNERVLLLNDNVSIPPTDIIEIKPLSFWIE